MRQMSWTSIENFNLIFAYNNCLDEYEPTICAAAKEKKDVRDLKNKNAKIRRMWISKSFTLIEGDDNFYFDLHKNTNSLVI